MVLTSILAATLALNPQSPANPQAPALRRFSVGGSQVGKKVSLHYDEASLKEVLNGLKKEKVDFVVDAESFKDRRVSLNLTDVPLNTALDAIAGALDAHWEIVGSVRILKKGGGAGLFFNRNAGGDQFRNFAMPKGFDDSLQFKNLKELDMAPLFKSLGDMKGSPALKTRR